MLRTSIITYEITMILDDDAGFYRNGYVRLSFLLFQKFKIKNRDIKKEVLRTFIGKETKFFRMYYTFHRRYRLLLSF